MGALFFSNKNLTSVRKKWYTYSNRVLPHLICVGWVAFLASVEGLARLTVQLLSTI